VKRSLGLLLLLATLDVRADFLIQHRLKIGDWNYALVIILPAYYGNFFGTYDLLHVELYEQQLDPVPDERIAEWKSSLQTKLWNDYEKAPFLGGQKLSDERFSWFRFAERFDDKRSAIFAILQMNEGQVAAAPGDDSVLRALVRLSSPIYHPASSSADQVLLRLMPWEIRALKDPNTAKYARESFESLGRRTVNVERRDFGMIPFGEAEELPLGRWPASFSWFDGVPLELKAWYHLPQTVISPTRERLVIDFLPDLLAIVHMYDGFERTGISLKDAESALDASYIREVVEMSSVILKKDLTPQDIGVRAGEFWTEVLDPKLALRERADFAMEQRFAFADPDFDGFTNHVLWTRRQEFFPALRDWANQRRGAAWLPLSRIVRNERWLRCVEAFAKSGTVAAEFPSIRGMNLDLR